MLSARPRQVRFACSITEAIHGGESSESNKRLPRLLTPPNPHGMVGWIALDTCQSLTGDGNVMKVSGHTQFLEGDLITVSASLQSLKELALQTATAPPSHGFV